MRSVGSEPADAAKALLAWAASHAQLEVTYGQKPVAEIRFAGKILLRVWSDGTLQVSFKTLSVVESTWDSERIEHLVERIEAIDGVRFLSDKRNWPPVRLEPLPDASKRRQSTAIVDDVLRALDVQT